MSGLDGKNLVLKRSLLAEDAKGLLLRDIVKVVGQWGTFLEVFLLLQKEIIVTQDLGDVPACQLESVSGVGLLCSLNTYLKIAENNAFIFSCYPTKW